MKLFMLVGSVLCLGVSILTHAAPDVNIADTVNLEAEMAVCAPCHSTDGNSIVPAWPKIAGQHSEYLLEQLLQYKKGESGKRFDPVMYGIVANFADADLQTIANFFAEQKMTIGTAAPDLVTLGKKIYTGGNKDTGVPACIACHGPRGMGNSLAKFPRLSGQHAEYTAAQLRKYQVGTRTTDINAIMRDISAKMSDAEIDAVSSYVAGLH